MVEKLKQALSCGFKLYKVAFIVYFLQLILALTIGIQIYQVLEASIGNSFELNKLLEGYDRTVVSDLLHVHGASISPLVGQIRWLVLAYLIFSVFINGGLLNSVWVKKNSWIVFWEGAARYFFSFLKVAIFFLIIFFALALILVFPVISSFNYFVENFSSEKVFVFFLFFCLLVFFLLTLYAFNWSVISRTIIAKHEVKVWSGLKLGFKWMRSNWLSSCLLLLALVFLQLVVVITYFLVGEQSGMVSPFLIFLFFLIQQSVVLFRIIWKIMAYSAISDLYLSEI
jgi:hypothetical protein